MAIASIYNVVGGTLAQYDQIISALGPAAQSPGGMSHIATTTPSGLMVVDVWESREAYEAFAPLLAPHMAAAGLTAQGVPTVGEVVGRFSNEYVHELPAVAVMYRFAGLTAAGYEGVTAEIAFRKVPAKIRRAHVAVETDEGIFIIAVWESEAAFRSFEPALRAAFSLDGIGPVAPVMGQIHRIAFVQS